MKGKSEAIRGYLLEHYPCQAVPHGDLTVVADKFGVSRERVRQLANQLGMGRLQKDRPVLTCGGCGKVEPTGTKSLCFECRWVELPCNQCGELVRRSAARIAWRFGRTSQTPHGPAEYTGRVFCNRSCQGAWMGLRNRKRAAHRS